MMATERSSSRIRVDFLTLLPDCLLKKILLPLPVESLVSLASTCKKWRDYLTDDDFARLHLDRWRSRCGILYYSYPHLVYSPIFDGKANKLILARIEDCFNRIRKDDTFVVLDSCDGLFLIMCDYYSIRGRLVVCNPLMRSFKLLQLPLTILVFICHWNMVYDASIKRYKIIGMTRYKDTTSMKSGVRGRRVYILELSRSSSESSEWKEVCICDDELGGADFGGEVKKSVLVDEKGEKKKLYYLTYRSEGDEVRTSLIYIDIETHQVKAVEAAACSSMSQLHMRIWVGSSSTGRFYIIDLDHGMELGWKQFYLFVLEDLHNPVWKRRLINGWSHDRLFIHPLAVVQHDGDDEEEKMLYATNGMIYEYQTGRLLSNDSRHYLADYALGYSSVHNFYVPHLHSLIII